MVIVSGAGKRQQLFAIGDGDRADIELFVKHLRHLHAVLLVEPLAQDPFGRGGNLQRRGRKGRGVLLKHGAFIKQNAHKQRRADGVSHHHRGRNTADQVQRIVKGTGNQQDDRHLRHFGHKGDRPGSERAKNFIWATTLDHVAVYQAAKQPFHDRRDHTAERRHPAHGITMQPAG